MKTELTRLEAFQAMVKFLEKHYQATQSDDIGSLLGGMDQSFWNDGRTFDPALWDDWMEVIDGLLKEKATKP